MHSTQLTVGAQHNQRREVRLYTPYLLSEGENPVYTICIPYVQPMEFQQSHVYSAQHAIAITIKA